MGAVKAMLLGARPTPAASDGMMKDRDRPPILKLVVACPALVSCALMLAAPRASADPAKLASKQSKLKGLLVRPLPTGENAGKASQMNATPTPWLNPTSATP